MWRRMDGYKVPDARGNEPNLTVVQVDEFGKKFEVDLWWDVPVTEKDLCNIVVGKDATIIRRYTIKAAREMLARLTHQLEDSLEYARLTEPTEEEGGVVNGIGI